ncbi:MAG: hypothetical protein AAF846_20490 [Chloroflexota bacterium]
MTTNLLDKGKLALENVPQQHLPLIVTWLEKMSAMENEDIEPEDLWLLITGELEKMNAEIDDAQDIEDWRTYLDEL